jgi:hypothetical protein
MSGQSPFNNPAAGASGAAAAYVSALLELVGDHQPLAVMDELVPELRRLAAGLDAAELATPEAPGKWSIVAVVQHLADTEIVYGYRLRSTVAEDRPALAGYDQDAWASRLRYAEVDFDEALEQLDALRRANLRWLRTLSHQERQRVGVHSERGEESVDHGLMLLAGHDLVHRRQIARIRRAIGR